MKCFRERSGDQNVTETSTLAHEALSEEQFPVYVDVVREATARKIPFALGGSLAMTFYARKPVRNPKDLDLYVKPEDRDAMIEVLKHLNLRDYYDTVPYDRGWIYRSTDDNVIVDVIWSMVNRRATVDDEWLTHGDSVSFAGEKLKLIPIEEMIWSKLYVLQRDRCDWPDILNIIDQVGKSLDWARLLDRIGEDGPLLHGVLDIYRWLCPDQAKCLPSWIWAELGQPATRGNGITRERANLIDSRPWFLSAKCGGESEEC